MDETDEKKRLRHFYSERRSVLSSADRRRFDAALCANLAALPAFRDAECVGAFVGIGEEPDLLPLIRGKRWFLPRYAAEKSEYEMVEIRDIGNDLRIGRYHIPEPRPELPAADPELVRDLLFFIVPAVSCAPDGTRLGRGGGFYDRLLDKTDRLPAAVIYSCQLAPELPSEPHDRPMGWVVTENRVYHCCPQKQRKF